MVLKERRPNDGNTSRRSVTLADFAPFKAPERPVNPAAYEKTRKGLDRYT
jgi:hypothetical protein